MWNNETTKEAVIHKLENAIMSSSCKIKITVHEQDNEPWQILSVSHMSGLRRAKPFSGAHLRSYLNSAFNDGQAAFVKWYSVPPLSNLSAIIAIVTQKYPAAEITHVWSHNGGNAVCVTIRDKGQAARFKLEYDTTDRLPEDGDLVERS